MNNIRIFIIFHFVWYLSVFVGFVLSLENKSTNSSPSLLLNSDSSHEGMNGHSEPLKHMDPLNKHDNSNVKPPPEPLKKIQLNTNKTHSANSRNNEINKVVSIPEGGSIEGISVSASTKVDGNHITRPSAVHQPSNVTRNGITKIPTEGGTYVKSDAKVAQNGNSSGSSTIRQSLNITVSHVQATLTNNSYKINVSSTPTPVEEEGNSSEKPKSKRIHGRPGVVYEPETILPVPSSTTVSASTTTVKQRKKKPLFTMITGDKETKESESFIESPTTGRDYVMPIVLIILALPVVGYIIKLIYKRGTEFTERQQYHRMYLIDGMYNSR